MVTKAVSKAVELLRFRICHALWPELCRPSEGLMWSLRSCSA